MAASVTNYRARYNLGASGFPEQKKKKKKKKDQKNFLKQELPMCWCFFSHALPWHDVKGLLSMYR